MKTILHILTRENDPLARECMDNERAHAETRVVVLSLTTSNPNYDQLLDQIFEADSISIW